MKIIEYKTARGDTADNLDKAVNSLIKEGFQPFQNPYSTGTSFGWIFQAMVKYE